MNTGFHFAYTKAVQALNFFARQNGGEIEKLHALKLVFFADRFHLRKYGRPITNDQYWAMRLGPVPSGVKDLFELDSASHDERHYAEGFFVRGTRPHTIRSIAEVDSHVVSQTDLEAVEFAWRSFGRLSGIVERTHNYPEWKRHEPAIEGGTTRVPMDYNDFLEDPPQGVNPCHPLTPDERQDRREQLREMADAVALWR
jgi:uncharacterized phage-associated protein